MQNVAAGRKPVKDVSGVVSDKVSARRGILSPRLELFLVIFLAALYLLWFAWPSYWTASENVRLVSAFNTDEEAHVLLLREAIDAGVPRLGYIQYGYGYLNMGLLPLFLLSYVMPISDQQIIVWLRIIPTLFAVATVALTFSMARRYIGRLAAWVAIFFLAITTPNFLEMAAMSHADMPQLFFLMLGIYFCCRLVEDHEWRWLIWASAAAGFAFGCKYSGLFLLPIIGFYGLLHTLQIDNNQIKINSARIVNNARLLTALTGLGALILGFVIIPYAAAPYAGTEYFGVSMPIFFERLRLLSIIAGIILMVGAALPFLWRFIQPRLKLVYLLKLGLLSAITFALSFFISSPFNVFTIRSGFVRGFLYESLHSGFGHSFQATNDRLEWFAVLISAPLLDGLVFSLALLSLAFVLYKTITGGWRHLLSPESVMWVWVLFYFIFLFSRVNIRTHRALLPIIPFLFIFAGHALTQLRRYTAVRLPRAAVTLATVIVLGMIVAIELPPALDKMLTFRQAAATREQSSDAVAAGLWLADTYPPSSRVLYDPFSYVPPTFAEAEATPWGGTLELLQTFEPDVILINDYNANIFANAEDATTFDRDEALFMAKYDYYQGLKQERLGYTLIRDFGEVQVYDKQK